MKKELELIIHFDNRQRVKTIFFIFGCTIIVFTKFSKMTNKYNDWIATFLQGMVFISACMLCLYFIYATYIVLTDNSPAATFNEKGVCTRQFGMIPWHEVSECNKYKEFGNPMKKIGVRVYNLNKLWRQAGLRGKLRVIGAKLFRVPPITLTDVAVEHEKVISFAEQFLKSK